MHMTTECDTIDKSLRVKHLKNFTIYFGIGSIVYYSINIFFTVGVFYAHDIPLGLISFSLEALFNNFIQLVILLFLGSATFGIGVLTGSVLPFNRFKVKFSSIPIPIIAVTTIALVFLIIYKISGTYLYYDLSIQYNINNFTLLMVAFAIPYLLVDNKNYGNGMYLYGLLSILIFIPLLAGYISSTSQYSRYHTYGSENRVIVYWGGNYILTKEFDKDKNVILGDLRYIPTPFEETIGEKVKISNRHN